MLDCVIFFHFQTIAFRHRRRRLFLTFLFFTHVFHFFISCLFPAHRENLFLPRFSLFAICIWMCMCMKKVSYLKPHTIHRTDIHWWNLPIHENSFDFFFVRNCVSCVPNICHSYRIFFDYIPNKKKEKRKRNIRFIVVVKWWKIFLVPKNMWLFFHSNRIALRNNVVGYVWKTKYAGFWQYKENLHCK